MIPRYGIMIMVYIHMSKVVNDVIFNNFNDSVHMKLLTG